jgi:hypothetical protein
MIMPDKVVLQHTHDNHADIRQVQRTYRDYRGKGGFPGAQTAKDRLQRGLRIQTMYVFDDEVET